MSRGTLFATLKAKNAQYCALRYEASTLYQDANETRTTANPRLPPIQQHPLGEAATGHEQCVSEFRGLVEDAGLQPGADGCFEKNVRKNAEQLPRDWVVAALLMLGFGVKARTTEVNVLRGRKWNIDSEGKAGWDEAVLPSRY